jgi:hypothetical protein
LPISSLAQRIFDAGKVLPDSDSNGLARLAAAKGKQLSLK